MNLIALGKQDRFLQNFMGDFLCGTCCYKHKKNYFAEKIDLLFPNEQKNVFLEIIKRHIKRNNHMKLCKNTHKIELLEDIKDFILPNDRFVPSLHGMEMYNFRGMKNMYGEFVENQDMEYYVKSNSSYYCLLCGVDYGCFPAREIINAHTDTCIREFAGLDE